MNGGETAENMYDRLVRLLGNWPALELFKLDFLPIPPAAAVNKAVNVAENLGDLMVEQRELELEEKKLELQKQRMQNNESKTESNNDESNNDESSDSDESNNDVNNESSDSDGSSDSKTAELSDTDSQTGGILFTKKECSFF
jgi:hypothetical protein